MGSTRRASVSFSLAWLSNGPGSTPLRRQRPGSADQRRPPSLNRPRSLSVLSRAPGQEHRENTTGLIVGFIPSSLAGDYHAWGVVSDPTSSVMCWSIGWVRVLQTGLRPRGLTLLEWLHIS